MSFSTERCDRYFTLGRLTIEYTNFAKRPWFDKRSNLLFAVRVWKWGFDARAGFRVLTGLLFPKQWSR